jgi:hypothetical protein
VVISTLRHNQHVQVWWLDNWWSRKITWLDHARETASVRLAGEDGSTSGILPRHIRL